MKLLLALIIALSLSLFACRYCYGVFYLPPDQRQHASINWMISIADNFDYARASSNAVLIGDDFAYRPTLTYLSPRERDLTLLNRLGVKQYSEQRFKSADQNDFFAKVLTPGLDLNSQYQKLLRWDWHQASYRACSDTQQQCSAYYEQQQKCVSSSNGSCQVRTYVTSASGPLRVRPELGGAISRDERVNFSNWYQYYAFAGARLKTLLLLAINNSQRHESIYIKLGATSFKVDTLAKLDTILEKIFSGSQLTATNDDFKAIDPWSCYRFVAVSVSNGGSDLAKQAEPSQLNLANLESVFALEPFIRRYVDLTVQVSRLENDFETSPHWQKITLTMQENKDLDNYSLFSMDFLDYQKRLQNIPYKRRDLSTKNTSYPAYDGSYSYFNAIYDARKNTSDLVAGYNCDPTCQSRKVNSSRSARTYSSYRAEGNNWLTIDLKQASDELQLHWYQANSSADSENLKYLPQALLQQGAINHSRPKYIEGENHVFVVTADNAGFVSLYKSNLKRRELADKKIDGLRLFELDASQNYSLVWRFIPPTSIDQLLLKQKINFALSPVLDAPTVYQKLESTGSTAKDILIIAQGRAGSAYTALDISRSLKGESTPPSMLWQLSEQEIPELGLSIAPATFFKSRFQTPSMSHWWLALSNGYRQRFRFQCKLLYFVDPLSGNVIRDIARNHCDDNAPARLNGLSQLSALDSSGDGFSDYLYGGDLSGKIRRVSVFKPVRSWSLDYFDGRDFLFQAQDKNMQEQAITTAIKSHKQYINGSQRILLALVSGKLLEDQDVSISSANINYSRAKSGSPSPRHALYILEDTSACFNCLQARINKQNLYELASIANLSGASSFNFDDYSGWYYEWPGKQEQALFSPVIINNFVFSQTFNLTTKACTYSPFNSALYGFSLVLDDRKPLLPKQKSLHVETNARNKIELDETLHQPLRLLRCGKDICLNNGIDSYEVDDGFKSFRRRLQAF